MHGGAEIEIISRVTAKAVKTGGETKDVVAVGYDPIGDGMVMKYEILNPDPDDDLGSTAVYAATVVGRDKHQIDAVQANKDGSVLRIIGNCEAAEISLAGVRSFFETWLPDAK